MLLSVYCDGGARGNPGPAAEAFVVFKDSKKIHESGNYLGIATNNVAEYSAVISALTYLSKQKSNNRLKFFLDSLLVVKQLSGEFKIKDPKLIKLSLEVKRLVKKINTNPEYVYIPRAKNKIADALVNKTLDEKNQ